VVELRVLNARVPDSSKPSTVSGYFDGAHRDLMARVAAFWSGRAPAVYATLNPVPPSLLARAANRMKAFARETTSDAQSLYRYWFPLDIDAVRPSGIPSTDAEHQAALARALQIREWLRPFGFPDPVYASSGNGAHLLYRCNLLNDAEITELFKRCHKALADRWDDKAAKVDKGVFNAARIWKLYGTLVCKGDALPDRPHRIARMLEVPDTRELVSREALEALAAIVGPPPSSADKTFAQLVRPQRKHTVDAKEWLAKHNLPVVGEKDLPNGKLYIVNPCPFIPEHTNRSA
jgi:hypothetical protein